MCYKVFSKNRFKKAFVFILMIILLFSAVTTDIKPVQVMAAVTGDVDGNGMVNATDALVVLKDAAKLVTINSEFRIAADVNTDGKIDANDALAILKYAAKLINTFVPEEETITETPGMKVWLPATGKKYHSISNCGSMNPDKARQVSKEEAIARGYEACSNCW